MENIDLLIKDLCSYNNETPWLEFKHNNYSPDIIGKNICALANGATLYDKSKAYMIWGIDDETHNIIGTTDDLQTLKKGNQELENWLRSLLSNNVDFEYKTITISDKSVGILIISPAISHVAKFQGQEYIKVGSYTKSLKEYPQLEAKLWDKIRNLKFEDQIAKKNCTLDDIFKLLDLDIYFDLSNTSLPSDRSGYIHYLIEEGIISYQDNTLYSISNMGALLFARKLSDFPSVTRKAIRIIQYNGYNKLDMLKNESEQHGYAVCFETVIKIIDAMLPSQVIITEAIRENIKSYPIIALREVIANALIHQDLTITGAGPTIEIFQNRIEITNPGTPLVDIRRIIDNPPRSRNEKMASLMRRLNMCEELGTGWDKIVISCELSQLPAPKITLYDTSTKVTLFSKIDFNNLSSEEKLWACYLHACIKHIQGDSITNRSLRERFGLTNTASSKISRLISNALENKFIKPVDPNTAPKHMSYIPYWA